MELPPFIGLCCLGGVVVATAITVSFFRAVGYLKRITQQSEEQTLLLRRQVGEIPVPKPPEPPSPAPA